MTCPAEIARAWIGTPYLHQAAIKGVGTDCLGLVRGIWSELYGADCEIPPPYSRDWGEMGGQEILRAGALRHFAEVGLETPEKAGEVLLFRMRRGAPAKHVGIRSGRSPARFIHAYDRHGVVDSPLSGPWQRRIVSRFIWP